MTFFDIANQLPEQARRTYQMEVSFENITKELFKKPVVTQQTKVFSFDTCMVGNMIRIATAARDLPEELFGATLKDIALPHIADNLQKLIYIVAAGIQNDHLEPEAKLISFVKNNFNHEQLLEGFQYTIDQLGMQSFINCLVLVKGTSILKGKPKQENDDN